MILKQFTVKSVNFIIFYVNRAQNQFAYPYIHYNRFRYSRKKNCWDLLRILPGTPQNFIISEISLYTCVYLTSFAVSCR